MLVDRFFRNFAKHSLYVVLPALLGIISGFLFKVSAFLSCSIIFAVLLLFLIPADSLHPSGLDYNAKRINPTFQPPKQKLTGGTSEQLLHFIVVLLALIVCIVLLCLSYDWS